MIAVFSVLLFTLIKLMTAEEHSIYDHINDIKVGHATKRWQAAFELSKILANQDMIPEEDRFFSEMTLAFKEAIHDDHKVRQYMALAMGRTGHMKFAPTLREALALDREAELPSVIYALGILRDREANQAIIAHLNHPEPVIRNRAVMALGFIGEPSSLPRLKEALGDKEPNVQWNAAVALAKLGDASGRDLLFQLLDRQYYEAFPEVDLVEQDQAIQVAIEAAAMLKDPDLMSKIRDLSLSDKNMNVRRSATKALEQH